MPFKVQSARIRNEDASLGATGRTTQHGCHSFIKTHSRTWFMPNSIIEMSGYILVAFWTAL
jgi:hypothetical protein